MHHALVTGANRGIGLEFTRQYLARGFTVFACCRSPAEADDLHALKGDHGERVVAVRMDVADDASVAAAASAVGTRPVDVLVNNAGTFGRGEEGGPSGRRSAIPIRSTAMPRARRRSRCSRGAWRPISRKRVSRWLASARATC